MKPIEQISSWVKVWLLVGVLFLFAIQIPAQTLSALRNFAGRPDGASPNGGIASNLEGDYYGTTFSGGLYGLGSIYKIAGDGTVSLVYSFNDANGVSPASGLTYGGQGIFYGAASDLFNLPFHYGVLFEFNTNTNVYSVLYRFKAESDGAFPLTRPILAGKGGLIGTIGGGANGAGLVYEAYPSGTGMPWTVDPIHSFTGGWDGGSPENNGVFLDSLGTLWGTTASGGIGYGVIYKIQWSGGSVAFLPAYTFSGGSTGANPTGELIEDKNGVLYGVTSSGGDVQGDGIVFCYGTRLGPPFTVLHTFTGGSDGCTPAAALTLDASGDIYGTTEFGGVASRQYGAGVVFELAKPQTGSKWTYDSVHIFSGLEDGAHPVNGPLLFSNGQLYGAAYYGGASTPGDTAGVTFRISSQAIGVESLAFSPTSVIGGTSLAGTVNLTGISGAPGQKVLLSSNETFAKVPASLHIDSGTTKGTFTLTSSAVAKNSVATITASLNGFAKTFNVTILSPNLAAVSISPASVVGGAKTTGTVKLNGVAPTGGLVVALSSNSKTATVPAEVTVLAGSTSATFSVTTLAVATNTAATITASFNGSTKTFGFRVLAPILTSFALSPTSLVGGAKTTGTVKLSGPAPAEGTQIVVTSNSKAATVPAKITIAAGSTSATFTVTTSAVTANSTATISCSLNGVTENQTLMIES
jgi:hypothetical protein